MIKTQLSDIKWGDHFYRPTLQGTEADTRVRYMRTSCEDDDGRVVCVSDHGHLQEMPPKDLVFAVDAPEDTAENTPPGSYQPKTHTNCTNPYGSNRNVLMCRLGDIEVAWKDAYGIPGRRVAVSPAACPDKKLYLGSARGRPVAVGYRGASLLLDGKKLWEDLESAQAVLNEPGLLAKLEAKLRADKVRRDQRATETTNAHEQPYTDLLNTLEVELHSLDQKGRSR